MLAQSLRPAKQRTATSIRTERGVSRHSAPLFQIQEGVEDEEKAEEVETGKLNAEGGETNTCERCKNVAPLTDDVCESLFGTLHPVVMSRLCSQ